jgi:GNAT superfamily N-acetyltransferase
MPDDVVAIRSARPDELDALLDLYHYLHTEDATLPPRPQLEALWKSIQDDPAVRYFVAELDGRIVSTCNLTIIPNLTRGTRPFGVIENVVTHADYRRRGIATAILRHALDTAWSAGCYKVMLMTGRKDPTTLRFYEQAGFKPGVKTAFIATRE